MQGDFEKKVQQQMEGFNLEPSAPVWEKIELQIRPEKKRRRAFFWFLGVLLLIASGWWMYSSQVATAPQHTMQHDQFTNTPNTTPQTSRTEKTTATIIEPAVKEKGLVVANREASLSQQVSKRHKTATHTTIASVASAVIKREQRRFQKKAASAIANEEKASLLSKTGGDNHPTPGQQPKTITTKAEEAGADTVSSKSSLPVKAALEPPVVLVNSNSEKKKTATASRWEKQLVLLAGWSHLSTGISTVSTPAYAYYTGSVSAGAVAGQPSAFTKGVSFAAGVNVVRTVGKRFRLSAGLQYAYHSVHSKVGSYVAVDTFFALGSGPVSTSGYYTNRQPQAYTTRFHVAELPVLLSYRPVGKLPLHLSVGASYGRLLSTNALTYHPYNNVYYRNRQNNHSDYVNLLAGLQYDVAHQPRFRLSVGPQVQYNLVPVQKIQNSKAQHLFFAGVKTAINF